MKNYSHNRAPLVMLLHHNKTAMHKNGFSLIEMLMALLVASLLMAALAPVMIKRDKGFLKIEGATLPMKKLVLRYHSDECSNTRVLPNGSRVCDGVFTVPDEAREIYVTLVGAGGGGGSGTTSGYSEFTTLGQSDFKIPGGVSKLEATLVSGGAGGGAGGVSTANLLVTTAGDYTWNVPTQARNRNVYFQACGAGGGAGGGSDVSGGSSAGSGAYLEAGQQLSNATTLDYTVGGGGGGGNGGTGLLGRHNGGGGGGGDWPSNPPVATLFGQLPGRGGNGDHDAAYAPAPISAGTAGSGSALFPTTAVGGAFTTEGGILTGGALGGRGGALAGGGGGGSNGIGGGGGGGATAVFRQDGTRSAVSTYLIASGGGGTAGAAFGTPAWAAGGAGGGGGGPNGGRGGYIAANWMSVSEGGSPNGSGLQNAWGHRLMPTGSTFTGEQCGGGIANGAWAAGSGMDGALRINYLDYGSGGSGGGGAAFVPRFQVKLGDTNVNAGNILKVIVGKGGFGGNPRSLSTANGTISAVPNVGETRGGVSRLLKSNDAIITQTTPTSLWCSAYPGNDSGYVSGDVTCGWLATSGCYGQGYLENQTLISGTISVSGFAVTNGKTAGNTTAMGCPKYNNSTSGGDGGILTTPWFNCSTSGYGRGGRTTGNAADNATSATSYGCGGGGGFGLANGGAGGDGYARIEWNRLAADRIGAGSGGWSGRTIAKQKIAVEGRTKINYTIGAPGTGGAINTATLVPANGTPGGNTTFGPYDKDGTKISQYLAGGGFAGNTITYSGLFPNLAVVKGVNDRALSVPCTVGGVNLVGCGGGAYGLDASGENGGDGGVSTQSPGGTGGTGDINTMSAATNGGIGAGGGGGSVGPYSNISSMVFPNGADGGAGLIIIEWY